MNNYDIENGFSNGIDKLFSKYSILKRKYDNPQTRIILLLYLFIIPVVIYKNIYFSLTKNNLIEYAVEKNERCVSCFDHGCNEDKELILGMSIYMKNISILSNSIEQKKIYEEHNGLKLIIKRYVDIDAKYTNVDNNIIKRSFNRQDSYCIQYHLDMLTKLKD
jgi:hypothetical protein